MVGLIFLIKITKNLLLFFYYSVFVFISNSVFSFPVDPGKISVANFFSYSIQDKFHLFADSENEKNIYYIAKQGFLSGEGLLDLSVNTRIENSNFGSTQDIYVSGRFETTESDNHWLELWGEANELGFTISSPSVIKKNIHFIADGFITDSTGSINSNCQFQTVMWPTGSTVVIPYCTAIDKFGVDRPLNGIYQINTYSENSGLATDAIQFEASIHSYFYSVIQESLASGSSWDHFLSGQVLWEIGTSESNLLADIAINWSEIYLFLTEVIDSYGNILNEENVDEIAYDLVDEILLGDYIYVSLAPGVSWGNILYPNYELLDALGEALIDALTNKALLPFLVTDSTTGEKKLYFTLTTNYELFLSSGYEWYQVYESTSNEVLVVPTDLSIFCAIGAIDNPIFLNEYDSRCLEWR